MAQTSEISFLNFIKKDKSTFLTNLYIFLTLL